MSKKSKRRLWSFLLTLAMLITNMLPHMQLAEVYANDMVITEEFEAVDDVDNVEEIGAVEDGDFVDDVDVVETKDDVLDDLREEDINGDGETSHTHDDITFNEWTDALAVEQNGAEATAANSLPTTEGSYYLTEDVTISNTWSVSGTTNLCLNGHGITRTGNGSVILIPTDMTLNLYDEEGDKGAITGGNMTGSGDYNYGGGVRIEGGTLNMYGGNITGNKATYGGGIYIKSGEFVMDGGMISDNDSSNNGHGGGVYINSGTFNLKSGVISGNKGTYGGGVGQYYSDTQFVMSGGVIQGNKTLGNYGRGGGIDIMGPFTMEGGKIIGNYTDGDGGAIYTQNNLIINEGEITGNSAAKTGGGIYDSGRVISVSGNVLIKDNIVGGTLNGGIYTGGTPSNVDLSGDFGRIKLAGELAKTASIGLTMKKPGVFTSSDEGINAIDYKDNFVSDDPERFIEVQDDGNELQLFRQPVSYLDENGVEQQCKVYTPITQNGSSWPSGWYVVNESVTINNTIYGSGTVNLILGDGATLTAMKGIRVLSGNTLNIYVQSNGASAGKLITTGSDGQAGIGSTKPVYSSGTPYAGGTVNIYGGDITATGGKGAAGIGGGSRYNETKQGCPGGTVNIYGGTVTAVAGEADDAKGSGVAIGAGGSAEDHGTLTIGDGLAMFISDDNENWTAYDGTRARYMVTRNLVTGISLDKTSQSIGVGGKSSFTATIEPDAADKTVVWSVEGTNTDAIKLYADKDCTTEVGTDATDVLTVYATGISTGAATIKVTATNGTAETTDDISATCAVTVEGPKTIVIKADNFSDYFGEGGYLDDAVAVGSVLDFQGEFPGKQYSLYINKKVTITSTSDPVAKFDGGENPGSDCIKFNIGKGADDTTISNIEFLNSCLYIIGASNVTVDNIKMVANSRGVGQNTGFVSIRTGTENTTVKNSYFENGGTGSFVMVLGKGTVNSLFENNIFKITGSSGNVLYGTGSVGSGDMPGHNTYKNNTFTFETAASVFCYAIIVIGEENVVEGNNFSYNGPTIIVSNANKNIFRNNTITRGGNFNMGNNAIAEGNVTDGVMNVSEGCIVVGNTVGKGMSISGKDIQVSGNSITGNVSIAGNGVMNTMFKDNEVTGTVNVNSATKGVTISGNKVMSTEEYAVVLNSTAADSNTTVTYNVLIAAQNRGDDAVNPGTGQGNEIHDNLGVIPLQDAWIQAIEDVPYTGEAIEPDVIVKKGDTTLTEGTDYTVGYSDNINAGEATVTITAVANSYYGGTVSATFNILPLDCDIIKAPEAATGLIYTGSAQDLVTAGTVSGGSIYYAIGENETTAPDFDGKSESQDKKWNITVPTGTDAGTYYVWYIVAGDENHNDTKSEVLTVKILPVNRESLISTVSEARAYYNDIKGNDDYAQAANDLLEAIKDAEAVIENGNLKESDIKNALTAISDAISDAKAKVKDADDTNAANSVKNTINALPAADEVKTADKDAIEEAREAYDALTDDQKAKISADTLKKLEDAEKALAQAGNKPADRPSDEEAKKQIDVSNRKIDKMVEVLNAKGNYVITGIYQTGYDTVSTGYTISNGKITQMSLDLGSLKEGKNYLTINTGVRLVLGEAFTISGNSVDAKEAKKIAKFVKTKKKEGCVFEPKRLKSRKGGSYQVTLTSGKKELIVDVIDVSLNKKAIKTITLTGAVNGNAISANAVPADKIGAEGSSVSGNVVTIATSPAFKTEIPSMKDKSARFLSGIWQVGDTYVSMGEIKTVTKGKVSVIVKANSDGTLSIGKAEGSRSGSLKINYILNGKIKKTKHGTKIRSMVYKAKVKVK
ncbi:MAG: hypothetical protein IKR56_05215 [Lachnospiraceae bacterium]|nr:hypothetical protein [Lachnospiraceae bacterium]